MRTYGATFGRRVATCVALATAVVAGGAASQPVLAGLDPNEAMVRVIITADDEAATRAVERTDGLRETRDLPLIAGVAATMPRSAAAALDGRPGIHVSLDAPVRMQDTEGEEAEGEEREATAAFVGATGATDLAQAGVDGRGVTVAVLDTGIRPLPDFGNRLVGGVDLSGENDPLRDGYGHGTFVAGLVAGDGTSSGGRYRGEAPGAKLVSIKVAGATGQTYSSTVIAGIQWAVMNREAFGIKVLNLSLGASPAESTTTAPLNKAVQKAWRSGSTVVASAGNQGPGNGSISKPGDDPMIITAGATDDQGTVSTADDTVTDFSSVGPTFADGWFKPDLVVPGRSVVSLRALGSTIDTQFPTGRMGEANFKGSGTSFSAAVTSGAAALVLQANPTATPDAVKGRLLLTAGKGPVGNPVVDGHGLLDAKTAATATGIVFNQSNVIRYGNPAPAVHGTVDMGKSWTASHWNGTSWNGTSWNGTSWNGTSWNG
ncbi:MAG: S8 family peptidase, partial [Actinomycetota bacterium]|nr:S8 family peptidase [Actinomycetota bacterium]